MTSFKVDEEPFEFTLAQTSALTADHTKDASHHGDHDHGDIRLDAPEGYIIQHGDLELQDAFKILRQNSISIKPFSRNEDFSMGKPFTLPYALCVLKLLNRSNLMSTSGRGEKLIEAIEDLSLRLKKLMPQIRGTERARISCLSLMLDGWINFHGDCCWTLHDFDFWVLQDFDLQEPEWVALYIRNGHHLTATRLENTKLEIVWLGSQACGAGMF